ncbi:isochorismatase family protein [Oceanisphaera avium]|uniref:nicotinamidase n=1 Tax=Oceanisphaera avium TaxID=1903694 RepID=A0A1Y0D061_9GAMM|nr:isochorismatase family protein [Oceanisphaera avium]ART80972.1 nicotinamidase [Oceanisphaera avium]
MQLPAKHYVASFDVDAQYTFTPACPDELPVSEGDTLGPELNAQAQFGAYRIGSKDAHSPHALWISHEQAPPFSAIAGKNMDIRWPSHAVPGTKGFELLSELPHPADYDFFVWKGVEPDMHPYGACYHDLAERMSTGVIEFLQAKQVTTVLIGGLATDYCVRHTTLQLLKAGFKVIVNLAATRGVAPDSTAQALEEMTQAGAQLIANAAALTQ